MQKAPSFMPFKDDSDFMLRMSRGEFDDWENLGEDAQSAVMDYINKPDAQEQALSPQAIMGSGMAQANQLGMGGYKDMSTPNLQGLMGMARAPQQQKQPYPMKRGLMGF